MEGKVGERLVRLIEILRRIMRVLLVAVICLVTVELVVAFKNRDLGAVIWFLLEGTVWYIFWDLLRPDDK